MDRRVGGVVLLAFALLAAFVVPRILHPPGVAGGAAVEPGPPPPTVGECVAQSAAAWGLSGNSEPVTTVSCSTPRAAEFALVEPPLPVATAADPTGPVEQFARRCWDAVTSRWGTVAGAAGWTPQLHLAVGVTGPDPRQAAAGQRWVACAVGPADGTIDRPLAAYSAGAGPPAAFGLCTRWQPESDVAVTVDCTQRHTVEQFGVRDLDRGSTLDQQTLAAACAELAAGVTGRPGLTADAALSVDTAVYARYDSGDTSPVLAPLPADAAGGQVSCSVRVVDDRQLAGSLRQIGDGPLPWAT